VAGTNNTID